MRVSRAAGSASAIAPPRAFPHVHPPVVRVPRHSSRRFLSRSIHPSVSTYSLSHRSSPAPYADSRAYATASGSSPSFAVLGAGITGLATAKYLRDAYPSSKITVFEQSDRTGGWIQSHVVETEDGEVIFETGTRSLRPNVPNGTLALRLIDSLGLSDELLVTSKNEPAATNRFIYYPDRLVRLPGPGASLWQNLYNAFSSGLFKGIPTALGNLDPKSLPESFEDESVGLWVSRRLGEDVANNVASAVFHGIYAGDIWRLSAKSILPWLFEQESRLDSLMDILRNMRRRQTWSFVDDIHLQMHLQEGAWSDAIATQFSNASVFTFQKGVQQLPDALAAWLRDRDVTIHMNHKVCALERVKAPKKDVMKVEVNANDETKMVEFDHVISTIPSRALFNKLSVLVRNENKGLKKLWFTDATNVAVVNFYFRSSHLLLRTQPPRKPLHSGPLQGFGYLIPNSVPLSQNPERALGVIFESDVTPDLWTSVPPEKQGTRLTVMMGGHWWDRWTDLPSESDCEAMARSVLERHLGITETPLAARATIQRDCIPQYRVGHSDRMKRVHEALRDEYGGRLAVAGAWYTGVGVNDCLRSAFETVNAIRTRPAATGLERFAEGRPMALVRRAVPGVVEVLHMEEGGRAVDYSQWKTRT